MSLILDAIRDLGELLFHGAEFAAIVAHDPEEVSVACFDLRGFSPFGLIEAPMDRDAAEHVRVVVAERSGAVILREGHAIACSFVDAQAAIDVWRTLLLELRGSTGHHVSGGLVAGMQSNRRDMAAISEQAAVLADAAGPGELLSSVRPTDDKGLVVERVGRDVPAVYSIRSRI
jgi:hypothetical protein